MLFLAADDFAPEAGVPGWLSFAVVGLLFLVVALTGRFLLRRNLKPRAERRCAGCGVGLSPDSSGALCVRCLSILSVSQLASSASPADGAGVRGPMIASAPMIPSLGPQTAQGIQAGAPSPFGIQSPDATPTAEFAGALPIPVSLAPDLIARFTNLEILEPLGKGGMGAVYKARQTKLDRLVALKVLPSEFNRDPTFAERFLREARALARLSHPGIVAVHDFGEADGQPYFLMEFVEGANLRHVIRGGKLTADQALALVTQMCEALQFAHDEGIIHRDIKPENILLDKKGRVKIADFGLAKLLGTERIELTLTATHLAMGTMNYMAPEQLDNAARVDHRADIYSLGVVFYEMLTGQVPRGKFDPPSHKAQVDARLDAVVLRALESDPEGRYQNVSEMHTAMQAIAQQGGVPERNPAGATALYLESNVGTPSFQSAFRKIGLNLDVEAIKRQVEAPAIGLMVTGVLTVLITLLGIEDMIQWSHLTPWHMPAPLGVFFLLGLPAGSLIILGSRKMLTLELFDMARLACILAMIPLGPAVLLGFPIGVWAMMILTQPRVRGVFRADLDAAPIPPVPETVRKLLNDPRRALLVGSFFIVVASGFILVLGVTINRTREEVLLQVLGIVNLLMAVMMIVASRSMATCRHYGLARLGSGLALMPMSPTVVITFPIGLWALRVLRKARVREAFGVPVSQAEWQEDEKSRPTPPNKALGFVLFVSGCTLGAGLLGVLLGSTWRPSWDWEDWLLYYGLPATFIGLVAGALLYGIYSEARKIFRRKPANQEGSAGGEQQDGL